MACLNFKVECIYLDLNIEILQLSQKPESILQQVCPDPLLCNSNFLLGRSQILCWGTMNVLNGSPDCAIFCFVGRQLLYVESHWLIKKIIKFYFENSAFTVFINRFFFSCYWSTRERRLLGRKTILTFGNSRKSWERTFSHGTSLKSL